MEIPFKERLQDASKTVLQFFRVFAKFEIELYLRIATDPRKGDHAYRPSELEKCIIDPGNNVAIRALIGRGGGGQI